MFWVHGGRGFAPDFWWGEFSAAWYSHGDGLGQPVPRISPLFAAPSPSLEFQYWAVSSHAQFVYTGGFLWVESWLSSLPVCHLEGFTQAFHLSVTSWEPQEPALHSQGSRVPPPSPCPPLHPHLRRMEWTLCGWITPPPNRSSSRARTPLFSFVSSTRLNAWHMWRTWVGLEKWMNKQMDKWMNE